MQETVLIRLTPPATSIALLNEPFSSRALKDAGLTCNCLLGRLALSKHKTKIADMRVLGHVIHIHTAFKDARPIQTDENIYIYIYLLSVGVRKHDSA